MKMNAPARRQGRPPTIENARGRILDEAAELFARDGYDGASLGSVADAVGVTKAAIYHYFPNKKVIYEAIIVRTLKGLLQFVSHEVGRVHGAEESLTRFMTAHAEYFEGNYHGFVTMLVGYGGMEDITMIAEAKKLRDSYEALLRNIVVAGIADSQFRQVDVHVTSRAVLSLLNWMVRWFKPGHGRPAAEFALEYSSLLLSGIKEPANVQQGPVAGKSKAEVPSHRRRARKQLTS